MFEERVSDRIEEANVDHAVFSKALLNSAREVCGETTGGRQRDRKTWWWNQEVQLTVRVLRVKRWQSEGTEKAHEQHREKNRKAKRTVALLRIDPGKTGVNLVSRTKEEQRCSR